MKRILALILSAAMVFCFAACGNTETAEDTTLVIGTNAAFPPFEFVVTSGEGVIENYDGIDILIAKEIGKDLGVDVKIENIDFDALLPSLSSEKIDVILAGMTDKPERRENADFSAPYWVAVQTIIVKADNTDITSAASLKGKKVGVITGYTGDIALGEMGLTDELQRYKKGIDAVMDLQNGRLDAVVIDSPTASRFMQSFEGLKGIEDSAFATEEYAIAVKKGNTELLDKINATITRLIENGDIERFAAEVDARLE